MNRLPSSSIALICCSVGLRAAIERAETLLDDIRAGYASDPFFADSSETKCNNTKLDASVRVYSRVKKLRCTLGGTSTLLCRLLACIQILLALHVGFVVARQIALRDTLQPLPASEQSRVQPV